MKSKLVWAAVVTVIVSGCTTGKLYYTDLDGNRILGCDVEFIGMPEVDRYAVEYALSLCAKQFVERGHRIDETHLLAIDTSIPDAPCGTAWSHDMAKAKYKQDQLTAKEYGYLVANIDLGLAQINECNAE